MDVGESIRRLAGESLDHGPVFGADDLVWETWAHAALSDFDCIGTGTQFADTNQGDRLDRGMQSDQADRLEGLRRHYDPDRRFCSDLTAEESTTALGLAARTAWTK